ncbi:hypothetical protein CHS0354_038614 [Potamilus streckersoni]|uniref:Uncharacterized protein n=1 Tax=Potamilus streckersoni TaxID=2493646 RepID=A0AAE0WBX1_9BIVA|nr:hypothetical protein CHS0354_038614 [Potamilus streckersoni]
MEIRSYLLQQQGKYQQDTHAIRRSLRGEAEWIAVRLGPITLMDVTGHTFGSLTTFDELRVATRRIESEHKHRGDELNRTNRNTYLNMASTSTSQNKELSELRDHVQQNSASHVSNNQEHFRNQFRTDNTNKRKDLIY